MREDYGTMEHVKHGMDWGEFITALCQLDLEAQIKREVNAYQKEKTEQQWRR